MRGNIIIYLAVFAVLSVTTGYSAEIEDIEMGEVDGYSYYARIIEKTGNAVIGGVYGEVVREKGGTSETVATFDVPYPSCYEAGIYPDGDFFYVIGDIMGRVKGDMRYICVFEMKSFPNLVMEYAYECIIEAQREYAFYDDNLYIIESFWSSGALHSVDFANRTGKKVVSALNLRFFPDGRSLYYEDKGPANWIDEWKDGGAVLFLYPATGDPESSCPRVPYKMDLKSGKTEKLFSAKASSTLVEQGKPTDYLGAGNAIDGDPATAWAEGIDGSGVGESLTIDFGDTIEVRDIGLIPGFAKAPAIYRGNNRVESARFEFSDGTTMTRSFNKKAEVTIFDLANSVEADSVTITILGVYPGDRWDDTCISEVVVNYW